MTDSVVLRAIDKSCHAAKSKALAQFRPLHKCPLGDEGSEKLEQPRLGQTGMCLHLDTNQCL